MEIRQTGAGPQIISGIIHSHQGRGKQLGVPTLNITPPEHIPDGVYAGFVHKEQLRFPAAIFIGAAITYDETERQAEAHILDAEINLTGEVRFELTQFIRPNHKFNDDLALQKQMERDIEEIRLCLQGLSKNS